MTTYKELFGKYVQNVSTDPTSTDAEGQIWYNSTSGTFKTALGGYGVWSSGGSLNTARNTRGAGTQTATIAMGGNPQNVTESYNGTSWTTLPATMATARNQIAAVGTQTSALAIGGYDSGPGTRLTNTEVWNGTSYSSGGALGTGVSDMGGSGNGTVTAALVFGGAAQPGQTNITQSYNGTSWSTPPATLSAPNATMGGLGIQTAALVFGGQNPTYTALTQSYNGTSWTTVNSLNTARGENIGGAGTQTAGLAFGGSPPNTGLTESWNGTSWTARSTMATGRFNIGGSGVQTSALAFGGATPSLSAATEEWTQSVVVPVAGSFSSGGALNSVRTQGGGAGTNTAGLVFGGYTGFPGTNTKTAATESYNGSSWTSVNSMNTARSLLAGDGTQSDAFAVGGELISTNQTQATEKWNGTSWTSSTNYPIYIYGNAGAGISTAAIVFGGGTSPDGNPGSPQSISASSNNFNGSSWTANPSMNTARRYLTGAGVQTAALAIGGGDPSVTAATESWNGSSWTTVNSLNTARQILGSAGTQTSAVAIGGNTGSVTGATEIWNGTSWTTNPNSMTTGRSGVSANGTSSLAFAAGGSPPGSPNASTTTELWTGPSTTLNYKTLTTS